MASPAQGGIPMPAQGFTELKPSKGSSRGVRSSRGTEMVDGSFMENGNFMNRSSPMTGGNQIPPQFMQGIPRGMEGMLVGGDSGAAMEMMGGGFNQLKPSRGGSRGVRPYTGMNQNFNIPDGGGMTRGMPQMGGGFTEFKPSRGGSAGVIPYTGTEMVDGSFMYGANPNIPDDVPQLMGVGGGNESPARGMPQSPQYNVNTAAAQGLQMAQQGAEAGMGYRPMAITAPNQAGLQQYTNPYESQVVQQSLDDLERSRLMAQNVGGAQAGAANAFGGSRQGIAEAETNRAFADQAARTASGLRQTGYQNAQQMERQAQMQNQAAGLSGAQQRLNAGSQLGNLSNLGFGMGQTIQGRMDQQGAMQQALNQQLINAAKGQYAGYTGSPAQSLDYLLRAVGGSPASGQATETYNAGLFDYLSMGAKAYAGNPLAIGKALGFGG